MDIEIVESPSITWKIYDLFGEDWGDFWTTRVTSAWDTDRALTTGSGSMTYLYDAFGDKTTGIIYTPYRWNIEGTLLTNLTVHDPMFMPVLGTPDQSGAEATVHTYSQYFTPSIYDNVWVPYWSAGSTGWDAEYEDVVDDNDDGWILGTWINVTMNRAAALEWLGMPTTGDPATWWSGNGASYRSDWSAWVLEQGNEVYDIFNGYDYAYTDLYGTGPVMKLETDGDLVILRMGHVTWGYEALLTRWLAASGLSAHQPYMEDIDMTLDYVDESVDVSFDAVCQWSMKCVKQDAATPEEDALCAWVWFPTHLDYLTSTQQHPDSAYDDYAPFPISDLSYMSWNCGDPQYQTDTDYEYTPVQFTLPYYGKLVVELPDGPVQGYHAEMVPSDAVFQAFKTTGATIEDYEALMYDGEMELGYCDFGDARSRVWDSEDKILTVKGPWAPVDPHPLDENLIHYGAPWIEFNVVPSTMASSNAVSPPQGLIPLEEPTPTSGTQVTSATSVTAELLSLATVISAVTILLAALVVGARRRHE